jgi:hypothetical protein
MVVASQFPSEASLGVQSSSVRAKQDKVKAALMKCEPPVKV